MKKIKNIKKVLLVCIVALLSSCTDLEEQLLDGVTVKPDAKIDASSADLLTAAYYQFGVYQGVNELWTFETPTDSYVMPTRGSDWDDNARHRQVHTLTWDPSHSTIRVVWNHILTVVYYCDLVINNSEVQSDIDQARFIKAFCSYVIIDMYGQLPYREKGSTSTDNPKVMDRKEATAFVIGEVEEMIDRLPARQPEQAFKVNKDAAHFLLAKLYLNKAVFNSDSPAGPYTFVASDMDKVVTHVNAISSELNPEYFENFTVNNHKSKEIIFSLQNTRGIASKESLSNFTSCSSHYGTVTSGWNGPAVTEEFYDKFEVGDKRLTYIPTTTNFMELYGNPIGLQKGVIYKAGGKEPVLDRFGKPLSYTKEVSLIVSGATIESAGVRPIKYEPDFAAAGTDGKLSFTSNPENDFVIMRYADALLMKAEAILRGATNGTAADATNILQQIAGRAGAIAQPTTLDGIYNERQKELWIEYQRRNDMIRFGKFLGARQLKTYVSEPKYVLFPIPADAVFNPNLKQNPGY